MTGKPKTRKVKQYENANITILKMRIYFTKRRVAKLEHEILELKQKRRKLLVDQGFYGGKIV